MTYSKAIQDHGHGGAENGGNDQPSHMLWPGGKYGHSRKHTDVTHPGDGMPSSTETNAGVWSRSADQERSSPDQQIGYSPPERPATEPADEKHAQLKNAELTTHGRTPRW